MSFKHNFDLVHVGPPDGQGPSARHCIKNSVTGFTGLTLASSLERPLDVRIGIPILTESCFQLSVRLLPYISTRKTTLINLKADPQPKNMEGKESALRSNQMTKPLKCCSFTLLLCIALNASSVTYLYVHHCNVRGV